MKIAVICLDNREFKCYLNSQPKTIQTSIKQIVVLSDIQEKEYFKTVLLKSSKNSTNYLINKIKNMSNTVEDLTEKVF